MKSVIMTPLVRGWSQLSNRDVEDPSDSVEGPASSVPFSGRHIIVNRQQLTKYKSNQISTAKYNLLTFIPKFLFEQFRRYANIFFLCIGLLQQIPDVSPTGKYVTIVPLFIILFITAIKEAIEDVKRHRADQGINNSQVEVLNASGSWESRAWKTVCVGDIVKVVNTKFFPADLILLASSEPQGMCYIETANLDGETNLKIRSANSTTSSFTKTQDLINFSGVIQCELPNRQLYEFVGNIIAEGSLAVPLSSTQLLLRGAKLMNTPWVTGVVVYTGHESKLLMNSTKAPLKRSNIDKITNYQIIFLFLILVCLALISAIANEIQGMQEKKSGKQGIESYIGEPVKGYSFQFGWNVLTFFILYNNLIPISLQVTLEMVKFVQAYFINWDEAMHYIDPYNKTETYAMARTSNLNEELGQIKYVFSDKTGTLTCNIMAYKKCSVAGVMYSTPGHNSIEHNGIEEKSGPDLMEDHDGGGEEGQIIKDFLVVLSVCHTVIPERGEDGSIVNYNAASPDEKALVEGAAMYGYEFINRTHESVIIRTSSGVEESYEILQVIEFTSTRKRMSVIVRNPRGEIKLYIKGADSVILERLGSGPKKRAHYDETIKHLEAFAHEGLRTLCLGVADIPQADYKAWADKMHKASTAIEDREKKIEDVAVEIEKNLTLIGATAIEDRLQDQVPETIEKLLEANIHVWVLTGDKQETAINIGKSCRLLKQNMAMVIINANSLDEARQDIKEHLTSFRNANVVGQDNEVAVIIDGKSLTHALDPELRRDFIDLCTSCKSVICCRVSPIQKADMVELVREHTGAISLAIGDGANDVAMIQKADVGVGISGNEGLQAANSADFAIGQFRFLSRLLFVHGAWNYSRISKVILYSFYKNITLYIIELWFAIYNYWSGQVIYERWTIGMYNLFFTSAPPVALGLFDKNCTAKTRETYPSLYHSSQQSEMFNHREFWKWIANSIFHSIILFWVPMGAMKHGVTWESGHSDGYLVLGNTVYTLVVVTTCLKAGLEMDAWTWFSHASIWGSILLWFLFLLIYSSFWPVIPLASNMAGMVWLLLSNPTFWASLIMVPVLTLIADVAYRAIKTTAFTSETDRIRIAEVMNSEVSPYLESHNTKLTESSSLLRNIRNKFRRNKAGAKSNIEMETRRGYAFSQEEQGAVSQSEFIRRYDTTTQQTNRQAQSSLE